MSSKNFFKWLYFGLHIKRWLALILIGVIFMALGIAYLLKEAYEVFIFPEWVVTITLQWLPRWIRGLAFIIFATSIILIGAWKLITQWFLRYSLTVRKIKLLIQFTKHKL